MNNTHLDQAREWAKGVHLGHHPEAVAAAKVIASLPDEWVDAEKVRGVIDIMRQFEAPKPRTLKDMTPEEREACQWMQADFRDRSAEHAARVVITRANQHVTDVVFPSGVVSCVYSDELTPLPDLPRMVWPEEHYLTTDEDMSIIPPKIDTSTGHDDHVYMTPEDVPAGEPWVVEWYGLKWVGVRNGTNIGSSGTIWSLVSMEDSRTRWGHDSEITLVSRLVPEYILDRAIHALETIAAMAEEVEYRIVDPDTNGGRYELRRWSRHVTEWSTDE